MPCEKRYIHFCKFLVHILNNIFYTTCSELV